MTTKRTLTLLTLILALVLLAACGGSEPAASSDVVAPVVAGGAADGAAGAYPGGAAPAPLAEAPAAEAYPGGEAPAAPVAEAPAAAAYPAEGGAAPAAGLRTFTIIPEESSAAYLVDEEFFEDALSKLGINAGAVDVVGITPAIQGQIQFDLASGDLGQTLISADLSQLSTDQSARDRWLRENGGGPQFGSFPQATFVAESAEGLPASISDGQEVQFTLNGQLTVRDTTSPVSFDVTAVLNGDTLSGVAETRLLMSSLGITPPDFARTLRVADEFGIRVELTARES